LIFLAPRVANINH